MSKPEKTAKQLPPAMEGMPTKRQIALASLMEMEIESHKQQAGHKPLPLALWHGPAQSAVLCPKDAYAWHLQVKDKAEIRRDCRPVSIVVAAVKARNLASSHCQECQQPGRLSAR